MLNEKLYSKDHLLKIRNVVSTLFLAERHYDNALLEQELLNLYEQESDKQAVSLFLNWFRQLALYGKVSPEDYEKLDHVCWTKEEVRTKLVATLEQERKKVYQEGKDAGVAEGRKETQRRTIGQLLQFRFDLAEAEHSQLVQQVAKIQGLPHLDALVDVLLNKAATLADFTATLTKYHPENKA